MKRPGGVVLIVALGGAVLFSLVSLLTHDYRLGEAASVYAQGIVEQAGGRILSLDGSTTRSCGGGLENSLRPVLRCVANNGAFMLRMAHAHGLWYNIAQFKKVGGCPNAGLGETRAPGRMKFAYD